MTKEQQMIETLCDADGASTKGMHRLAHDIFTVQDMQGMYAVDNAKRVQASMRLRAAQREQDRMRRHVDRYA